jgi:hypothetical protein
MEKEKTKKLKNQAIKPKQLKRCFKESFKKS